MGLGTGMLTSSGFKLDGRVSGQHYVYSPQWYKLKAAGIARATGIAHPSEYTSIWKDLGDGTVDLAIDADTIHSSGIKLLGAACEFRDRNFQKMDFDHYASGETLGWVRFYKMADAIYKVREDGAGGSIGLVTVGSVGAAFGATIPTFNANQFSVNPEPLVGDLLYSSTYNAANDYNAFNIIGGVPEQDNDGGTSGIYTYKVRISDTFQNA